MKTRFVVLVLLISLLSLQPMAINAQATAGQGDWSAVQTIERGSEVVINTKQGEKMKGKLESVSDTSLTINRKRRATDVGRADVKSVYLLKGNTRGKTILKGAAIGGAAGLGTGLTLYLPNQDDIIGWVVPSFAMIGAGIGALIGLLVGRGQKQILIYEAR